MDAGIGSSMEKWTGGATAHGATLIGELSPSAFAQREEARKARIRARIGNYGYSAGQMQQAKASTQESTQAALQQQQADIARAAAAGALSGGQMQQALANASQAAATANAQGAAAAQQMSDQFAQTQHAQDQARIDAQAARWREMNDKQANISMQTTGASQGGSQVQQNYEDIVWNTKKKNVADAVLAQRNATGAAPVSE